MKTLFPIIIALLFCSSCTKWRLIEGNYDTKTLVPRSLFQSDNSEIYLGARQGLYKLHTNNKFIHIDIPVSDKNTLRGFTELNGFMYAGFEGAGLFRSEDKGITWNKLDENKIGDKIWGIHSYDSVLIVVTWPRFIYRSSDNGKTWLDISHGMPEDGMGVWSTQILKDSFLFCSVFNEGIFRKGINETKWIRMSEGLPEDKKVRGIEKFNNTIFCGTENGVYKSENNGESWLPYNEGMKKVMIISFLSTENKMFATSNQGRVYSLVNGKWNLIAKGLHKDDVVYDIVKNETDLLISVDGQGKNLSGVYSLKIPK
jgi:hypothetical protein